MDVSVVLSEVDLRKDWFLTSWHGNALFWDGVAVCSRPRRPGMAGQVFARPWKEGILLGVIDPVNVNWVKLGVDRKARLVASPDEATCFELVAKPEGGFGICCDQQYMCCNGDGETFTVSFDRPALSEWETFFRDGYVQDSLHGPAGLIHPLTREKPRPSDAWKTYATEPLGITLNGGVRPVAQHRFSLVACARWEENYIVEWINYHKSIGFDHIYLYCNDDEPDTLYGKILPFVDGPAPFVTFYHYPFKGLQYQMYFHFLRHHATETEWLMFLDVDEFLCLRHANDVALFMQQFPADIDALYFNWCLFGNNGYKTRPSGDVLTHYTRREHGAGPFTKVLIKSASVPYREIYRRSNAAIMHSYLDLNDSLKSVNVLNEDMAGYYENFPDYAWSLLHAQNRRARIVEKGFIAHFNIKSEEDFDIRVRRSLAGNYACEAQWGERTEHERTTFMMHTNVMSDTYLRDYWQAYLKDGWKHSVFPKAQWPLLSQGKSATQSSTAHAGTVQDDAIKILSGEIWGKSQNHTLMEDNPWWVVDLGDVCRIHEIRFFNRMDGVFERVANFRMDSSEDGESWVVRFEKRDDREYGGIDGAPYICRSDKGFDARHVRIVIPGKGKYLHFDQVQIYGTAPDT